MKKQTLFLLLFSAVFSLSAQQIPLDNKVRYGILPNGMTYYIRFNNLPEQRADFFIAQKVGSILEEENQRGLAHFLEHMAFNGTENFPGTTALRDYLQSVGVKFGENLNAYTSVDRTVYMIKNVPTIRQGILDSSLLVLRDWSSFITLEDSAIDKERGIIHEEWRTRSNANNRMYEKILPEIYGGDRYGHRLPIGLMSVVNNFKYQELRDYYHKWYRPDLQGIIIVGDFDIDEMENRVKTLFSAISAPVNPAERVYFGVSDNKEPIISIASDPEATRTTLMMFHKHEAFPPQAKGTAEYLMLNFIRQMASDMINHRFQEIIQKPDAPFTYASASDDSFFISKTKDAWTTYAVSKEGEQDRALATLVQETRRMTEYGFTQTEYDRVRADFLKAIESAYAERDKQKNNVYVDEYIEHFLENEPAPGIEFEYEFYNKIVDKIPVDAINEYVKGIISYDKNEVIVLMMPQKEGLEVPTEKELLAVYNQAKAQEVLPYIDKIVDTNLVRKSPKAGKVKSVSKGLFTTEWTLSNGIKVQYRKTNFKEDQILMKGVSLGGTSLLNEKDMPTINLLNDLITLGGVGEFSRTDLSKALAGKKVSVSPSIGLRTEVISGSCSPTDFETMMQLVYLYFTQPRADEDAYEAYISRKRNELKNAESNPRVAFSDSIVRAIYGDNPRAQRMKLAMLDDVNYALAMQMYKQRFMNADAFTFTFVGNINADAVKPIIEKYLGGLSNVKKQETFADVNMRPRKGFFSNVFDRAMETPKSSVFIYYSGDCDYTLTDNIRMDMLQQIMTIVYTEKVREQESGTYGVRANGNVSRFPNPNYSFQVTFDTDPALRERLVPIILQEIDNVMTEGPSETHFNIVKEFMLKKAKENSAENGYWLNVISELNFTGLDINSEYEKIVNQLTPEDIKDFASYIFSQGNRIEVVMEPEK